MNSGSLSETYNYGYSGGVTINTSADGLSTTMGQIHNTGGQAKGNQSVQVQNGGETQTDEFDYSSSDSYTYVPSWTETFNNSGMQSSSSATDAVNGASDDPEAQVPSYSETIPNGSPGFYGQAYIQGVVVNPYSFSLGGNNNGLFGYQGTVPPPGQPQAVSTDTSALGAVNQWLSNNTNGWWDASKALIGQASPSVQQAFDQSVSDRSLGLADVVVRTATSGLVKSVGGPTYDPADRANEQMVGGVIIAVGSMVIPIAGPVESLLSAGDGLVESSGIISEGSSAGEIGELGDQATAATDAVDDASVQGCFVAGTLALGSRNLAPIEQITVGRRVRPTPDDRSGPSIDPSAYRLIRLSFVKDGQHFRMAFLRPAKMFEGLGPGDTIGLSVLELKIQGQARVLAVEPCPPIEEGPGRIVTGAFSSQTVDLWRLSLAGIDDPIEVTGNHPIYSEDRQDFVPASQLRLGERLRTRGGTTQVSGLTRRHGEFEVFNLEVDGAHQYYVAKVCVLVHNGNGVIQSNSFPRNCLPPRADTGFSDCNRG